MNTVKKRFIAGATCPSCQKMDTIRTYRISNINIQECIACDYTDNQDAAGGQGNITPKGDDDQIAIHIIE
jgi:uncharacterized protein